MAHKYRHVDHVSSKLCYWNGRLTMSVYIYVYFYSISRFILVMKNGHKTYMMSSIDVIKLIGSATNMPSMHGAAMRHGR